MQSARNNPFPPECCYITLAANCNFCFPNNKKSKKVRESFAMSKTI